MKKKNKKLTKSEQTIFDLLIELADSTTNFEGERTRVKVKSITKKANQKQKEHVIKIFDKKTWKVDPSFMIETHEEAVTFFEVVSEELADKILTWLVSRIKNRRNIWINIGLEMFITFQSNDQSSEYGFPTISYLYPVRSPAKQKATKKNLREKLNLLLDLYAEEFEEYQKRNLGYAEINGVEVEVESK